jgi:hypothetical protein
MSTRSHGTERITRQPTSRVRSERRRHYLALLERLHRHLRPRTYVEIGVHYGASFSKVLPGTLAVGIDPILSRLQPINRDGKYFAVTSDVFFADNDLRAILNGSAVDLAFIDGMHLFEFALRDFLHLERYCTEGSIILIHDCYPVSAETASRERPRGFWSGDVWKLIPCLKEHRPDLQVSVVDVPPTGLAIVTTLDPNSTVLEERYEEIFEEFVGLDYAAIAGAKAEKLNGVENDWELVRGLLPNRRYREL